MIRPITLEACSVNTRGAHRSAMLLSHFWPSSSPSFQPDHKRAQPAAMVVDYSEVSGSLIALSDGRSLALFVDTTGNQGVPCIERTVGNISSFQVACNQLDEVP